MTNFGLEREGIPVVGGVVVVVVCLGGFFDY